MKRLSKVLAARGIASRRACEEIIFSGSVRVNGALVTKPQTLVDPAADQITVNGKGIPREPAKVYYLLNKPKGVHCTAKRQNKENIVLDLFSDQKDRLFTVGRLDKDTRGLLIVTNDGQFAQKIGHPSYSIMKEYLVRVKEELSESDMKKLMKTVYIDGTLVKPIKVKKDQRKAFRICVKDGKKHEIRIITEKAELSLVELKRIRIGSITLGTLPEGSYRRLTSKELELFFK